MSQIRRTWLAFAAIGAGFVHLALVISAPLPIAIVLAGLGIAELGWGVVTFGRERPVAPVAARIVAAAPIVLWSLLVVAATVLDAPAIASSLAIVPMGIAAIFEVFAIVVLTAHLRRQQKTDAPRPAPPMPSAGRYLIALFAGALIAGGLTTPALAATQAGRYAQPHGQHNANFVPPSSDGDPLPELIPNHTGH